MRESTVDLGAKQVNRRNTQADYSDIPVQCRQGYRGLWHAGSLAAVGIAGAGYTTARTRVAGERVAHAYIHSVFYLFKYLLLACGTRGIHSVASLMCCFNRFRRSAINTAK